MNNIQITINAEAGAIVNIYNASQPYKSVTDKEGLLHTFYNKSDYEAFLEELNSKNK